MHDNVSAKNAGTFALTAMILGILAVSLTPIASYAILILALLGAFSEEFFLVSMLLMTAFSSAALICGIVALNKGGFKGRAITAIATGGAALLAKLPLYYFVFEALEIIIRRNF